MKSGRSALGRGLNALISTQTIKAPVVSILNREVEKNVFLSDTDKISVGSLALKNSTETQEAKDGLVNLSIDKIEANPKQPRAEFAESELNDLARSIQQKGVLQPILVRPNPDTAKVGIFQIVAGERRWRAAKAAGITFIPALIRDLDDRETLEIALVENVQRAGLNPIEEAHGYERLCHEFQLSQAEVADRVGKDRATVANSLRLLKLPSEVISLLISGIISVGHAKAILSVKEPSAQISLARKVEKESLSVRELENIVSRVVVLDSGRRVKASHEKAKGDTLDSVTVTNTSLIDAESSDEQHLLLSPLVERLRRALGTKVILRHLPSGRGRIQIEYFSNDELERIVDLISR
jgi:ParB family chromosome partitioning protein